MVKHVSCCRMTQNLAEIAAILWQDRRGSLPVLDDRGNVASVITDRDVCIALGTRNLPASEVRVCEVVPPRVFTCRPDDDALDALDTMVTQNVRRLPVVDEYDKPAGILSIDDLIRRTALDVPGETSLRKAVVTALKTICDSREPGMIPEHAEVVATHA